VSHAVIGLQRNGSSYEVSSRPSDAIALAVRLGCKIFANEDVLEEASILIPPDGEGEQEEEKQVQEFREFLENVTPDDFE
jgi:bifunctional DNase/RNase